MTCDSEQLGLVSVGRERHPGTAAAEAGTGNTGADAKCVIAGRQLVLAFPSGYFWYNVFRWVAGDSPCFTLTDSQVIIY